jgi:hypothetical protein
VKKQHADERGFDGFTRVRACIGNGYELTNVFGLEAGGIAYTREFLDANQRKLSPKNLELLAH